MGTRSDYPASDAEMEALTLSQLNAEIERSLFGYENSGTSQGRKAFFKRLIWLEAARERLHGIASKPRRFGA